MERDALLKEAKSATCEKITMSLEANTEVNTEAQANTEVNTEAKDDWISVDDL